LHTREKTLQEALRLFSEKGYEAVSVRDIARAVGVKESSLFNHFRNKQLFSTSILAEYSIGVRSSFGSMS
jgi:AcrR family transcriptional regulator